EVWLDRAPLKYQGLSYTEIWISEAQERMILAVPPQNWPELSALAAAEGVEATVIGQFVQTGRLKLKYGDAEVADLSMEFLHGGRPPVVREATFAPAEAAAINWPPSFAETKTFTPQLRKILGSLNVCSKEWVIRQYDHEVQGGSVIKPLVGVENDGPSDAAVVRPVLSSRRGLVIGCGMNPRYGDFDTYHMAASAIDEAIRNCVAVGADPDRIAILDNFCWGDCERPETLGSLVRAAVACHDVAVALGAPFISGKDSLNNEFRWKRCQEPIREQPAISDSSADELVPDTFSIAIPPSLLISAIGQIADVSRAVTMDLKHAGDVLYQVGLTKHELGGSHLALVENLTGGQVPKVNPQLARATFAALHKAIELGSVRACHDLSEGGLAVAAAEMAFAGGLGARIFLEQAPNNLDVAAMADSPERLNAILLFAESNTRFLCEVPQDAVGHFESTLGDIPHAAIGEVLAEQKLQIVNYDPANPFHVIVADIMELKETWQQPLRW
ncbi:MAG TPA: AIR synthase-related protein, partial [Pirellulales bacterium]